MKSKKILLVDDEEAMVWIMEKILNEAGHTAVCAVTARAGMEKINNSKELDIAIVDLVLDEDDGLTFIKKARSINREIKFIMISAYGTPENKSDARELGVCAFLDKPFKPESLLNAIDNAGLKEVNRSSFVKAV